VLSSFRAEVGKGRGVEGERRDRGELPGSSGSKGSLEGAGGRGGGERGCDAGAPQKWTPRGRASIEHFAGQRVVRVQAFQDDKVGGHPRCTQGILLVRLVRGRGQVMGGNARRA